MAKSPKPVDRVLLVLTAILVVTGFFLFMSASLGLLAREGAPFSSVAFSQLFFGIFLGTLSLIALSRLHYRFLRQYALYIFLASIGMTLLVFIPGIGFEFNGANRWLVVGPISFQPAEFLKLGFVLYFATWLSGIRDKLHTFHYSVLPFLVLLGVVSFVLLLQPDTGTLLVMGFAGLGMFVAAGARWRHISILVGTGLMAMVALVASKPYIMDRFRAYIDPSFDPLGVSYHIQQSLIAIGSGEIFGRGFGQSIQKFNYLPEPVGDAIFAVAAEEFGFIGSTLLILLFLVLALKGFRIAATAPDYFSGLVVIGLVILIVAQSFINIASMLGVLPLTGLPLLFVSHGGSALLLTLAEIGIILGISRYRKH